MPPLSVRPPTPVSEISPPGAARPNGCVAPSTSPQVAPPSTRARRRSGSTRTPRIADRSIIRPASPTAWPATLCAAATDGDRQFVGARERHGRDHVPDAVHPDDEGRATVDHRVPDRTSRVIAIVGGREYALRGSSRAAPRRPRRGSPALAGPVSSTCVISCLRIGVSVKGFGTRSKRRRPGQCAGSRRRRSAAKLTEPGRMCQS